MSSAAPRRPGPAGGLVEVAKLQDLSDRRMHIVEVGGREIGLLRWGQRLYALRNVCPHQFAPLCSGSVSPKLVPGDAVGEFDIDKSEPVVECPWHGWEFYASTGRAVAHGRMRVATYPVQVDDGRVLIDLSRPRRDKP